MNRCVVDASAVAAALLGEPYAAQARRILASKIELIAPDLLFAEMGNVLWKRTARGDLTADEAAELLADVLALPIALTSTVDLIEAALDLATHTGRTVYDCLYLALAISAACPMITADQRLVNALKTTPLRGGVLSLRDLRG